MLIKLSDYSYVDHTAVARVSANYYHAIIHVFTKDGGRIDVRPKMRTSLTSELDRIVQEVNAAEQEVQQLRARIAELEEVCSGYPA